MISTGVSILSLLHLDVFLTLKWNFLRFCYKRIYPYDHQEKVNRVKVALSKLFVDYRKYGVASNSIASFQTSSSSMTMGH